MADALVNVVADGTNRDALLEKLRDRICSFAASKVPRDVAEDITQDVFMLLITKYADKTELSDLVPVAFRIVRFKLSAYRAKTMRRREHLTIPLDDLVDRLKSDSHLANPDDQLQRQELSRRLLAAFDHLGDRCRRIFLMKLQGHGFAAIQHALRANSINTVYTWDARCRQRLLELMGGSWEE